MRADRVWLRAPAAVMTIAAIALALRVLFPAADPPWYPSVGIVWHDEGAWVHNARNRALHGSWFVENDAWNPLFIAPVFTGLEYVSFALFGVGIRQARLVSEIGGLASVLLLSLGVRRLAGTAPGLAAGALLATNYVYVMYNRAALMETTMVVFMVAAWYCYVRAQAQSVWGAAAGICALLAFFTKAAAAFFVLALGIDALIGILRRGEDARLTAERRAGWMTLTGLVAGTAVALAAFVAPNWQDYRFYNWQMSVTRKPTYTLKALADRAAWFPILHDLSTRMWFVVIAAMLGLFSAFGRLRTLRAPERLLMLWVLLGAFELVVHDVGNERRFIFFIPPLIAIAAMLIAGPRDEGAETLAHLPRHRALLAAPLVLFALYVAFGGIARLFFLYEIRPGVWLAAVCALFGTTLLYAAWPWLPKWLGRQRWSSRGALAAIALVCLGDIAQYFQWASGRTYKNYEASKAIGRALPAGTAVHGKLANGLALENRIRPVFVGREFGNYADRKRRDDVRYILTYIEPRVGYEGPVIQDVLDAYPQRRIIMTFDVAETTGGHDRAALVDKFGMAPHQQPAEGTSDRKDRAHD
jgi:4-amino-4-deoxy-L-arabinose transferase-like glycosyltransferase